MNANVLYDFIFYDFIKRLIRKVIKFHIISDEIGQRKYSGTITDSSFFDNDFCGLDLKVDLEFKLPAKYINKPS